jgi:hypothetical protein
MINECSVSTLRQLNQEELLQLNLNPTTKLYTDNEGKLYNIIPIEEQVRQLLLQDERISINKFINVRELKILLQSIYQLLGMQGKPTAKDILRYLPSEEKRYYNKDTKKVTRAYRI